ncbi:phage baseplate protein [Paenibacillus macerans]|uniref:phage baseplate protein n=1 Tax=Paenibacillus macerans TaxID=44252 RepID=UPI003D31097E
MALLNGMYIMVESEEPDFPIEVTDQPVEKGIDLTDHVQRKARTISLSGYIVGDNAVQVRDSINQLKDAGEIVTYSGRNLFSGLIVGFSGKHDSSVANGFSFTMDLREVRIAQASFVQTLPAPVKAQVAKIVNSGTKQTKDKNNSSKKTSSSGGSKKQQTVQKVKFKKGSPWA